MLMGCVPSDQDHKARAGLLDLRGSDLAHRVVRLDGDWRLVWEGRDTLTVRQPGSWVDVRKDGKALPMEGHAVYLLNVLLDSAIHERLVLSTKEVNSESRIRVNGKPLPPTGRGRLYQCIVADSDTLKIEVHVSNRLDVSPGMPCPVYLGNERKVEQRSLFYLGLQCVLLGIFALFTLMYLSLWIRKRKENALLILACNTMLWGIYTFFQGFDVTPAEVAFPHISMLLQQKTYLVTVALFLVLTSHLWLELFPTKLLFKALPVLWLVALSYVAVLVFDPEIHWRWFVWYLVLLNVFLLVLLWIVAMAVRRGEPGAAVFLVGLVIMSGALFLCTLVMRGELVSLGALTLVLADAFLLARRRDQAFDLIAEQRTELERVIRLKEELATAVRDKFHLSVRERRLSSLMQLLDVSILVLDSADRICFSNGSMQELLGFSAEELSQKSWSDLCSQEAEIDVVMRECILRCADGRQMNCKIRAEELAFFDDSLHVFFVSASIGSGQMADSDQTDLNENKVPLARDLLRLSVDVWSECTGLTKADFAEASGIWSVSIDKNGWRRTQTLDRYLSSEKSPKLLKWNKILDSVGFVEETCKYRNWSSKKLEKLLEQRERLLRDHWLPPQ